MSRYSDLPPLKDRAQGRWAGILSAIGIESNHLRPKHGPCPMCGGKDRFRFDDKEGRGTWICSHCGAGDGVDLVMRKSGCDFKEAARRIESVIGEAPQVAQRPAMSDGKQREERNKLWLGSKPVAKGDQVDRYLEARGVSLDLYPVCLRTGLRVMCTGEPMSFHPAMIALVHGADGRPATLHRTYLDEYGDKARVESPRRVMPGAHPKGSAVRLAPADLPILGIAEGIETALAASRLFGIPCWAALNAAMLDAWSPPEGVNEVFVFGDNDASFTGQNAAFSLAWRLTAQGIRARVEIPQLVGTDWNDALCSKVAPCLAP
jgi:putative DNA primase/helicase